MDLGLNLVFCQIIWQNLSSADLSVTARLQEIINLIISHILLRRGALGFLVLRIWPKIVLFVFFGFRSYKLRFFGFGVSCGLQVYFQFSLWFSVFVNNDGGFSDSSSQFILRFFWGCQGCYTSQSR